MERSAIRGFEGKSRTTLALHPGYDLPSPQNETGLSRYIPNSVGSHNDRPGQ